ncbi:tRNA lysidine(34) synthetase TilS [Paenibacillus sediminis]|uniref:tRNA(Ile)-lysidine synthase n=1 Tax=Paenibacillus sediminis TaxID=664909 RepID=A0ABS4H7J1_9BACL|nr:tRNA lysidine(34) synthetase TilS [Paenibacillus sediminis]MBP1938456.1 tRNA(Ile)-lysidine synthase [Paenibacillus sediminis]
MGDLKMYTMAEQVRKTAQAYHLWSPHDRIIVAVSGGPDSVTLLHVLHYIARTDTPLELICAHVNHSFRGAESDAEAEMVRETAFKLGIPFELAVIDVPAYMKESGKGTQLAAREKRYQFLLDVADKYKAQSIALAHHADDQAETVLMRLLRGSGPTGLAGMKIKRREKNVELIRPFLRIYKSDLIELCEAEGFSYVIDSSNLSNKYARNEIRLDVLPFLGKYNRQLPQSLNRLAEVIGEEDDYMSQSAKALFDQIVTASGRGYALSARSFTGLHVALQRRLIQLILNYLSLNTEDIDFVKIEAVRSGIIQEMPTTWSLDLGGGLRCVREYDHVSFLPDCSADQDIFTYTLERKSTILSLGSIQRSLVTELRSHESKENSEIIHSKNEAIFDADKLNFPLTVRSRLPGDVMKVMGLNGSKKVKDIFIDDKIPPSMRHQIPIVTDASGTILWIPGVRRSVHAAVTQQTTSILYMRLEDIR